MLALAFLISGAYFVAGETGQPRATSDAAEPSTAMALLSREAAAPFIRTAGEMEVAWDDLPGLDVPELQPEEASPPAEEALQPQEPAEAGAAIDEGDASVLQAAAPAPPAPAPLPATAIPPAPQATATPRPAPTSPPASAGLSSLEQQLFDGQNGERTGAGLAALRSDSGLLSIARHRASDMATKGYFSHTSPTGETAFTLIAAAGIYAPYAGENIGYNTYGDATSASSILAAFMSSPGHRANILNGNYTRVGVGVAVSSNGTKYFAVVFAGP